MHLQPGPAEWRLGATRCTWPPAGAHLHAALGPRYANIATGAGSPDPEPGTLESLLTDFDYLAILNSAS